MQSASKFYILNTPSRLADCRSESFLETADIPGRPMLFGSMGSFQPLKASPDKIRLLLFPIEEYTFTTIL
jgi:hypothetical protein